MSRSETRRSRPKTHFLASRGRLKMEEWTTFHGSFQNAGSAALLGRPALPPISKGKGEVENKRVPYV